MFSQAAEVAYHLGQNRRLKRLAAAAYVILALGFIGWSFWAINPKAPIYGFFFCLASTYGCTTGLLMMWSSLSIRQRAAPPADFQPTVDVLVPVYTEPVDMIELTVIGALSIDYPHETFLLDDGKRPELKALAEKHGVRYVAREGNRGSKAGNLNDALPLSKADFVIVFDADHIAQREALDSMIGYFKDPAVGMVQAPQLFYNEDSFLYLDTNVGAGRWHEQALFMDVIQANRDFYDGSSCIGTGVVYRRSAIAAIGGFPEATLTEDLHTSLLMHKRGMKTVYVNEPVAWGVAAADVSEFYKTRRRWAYGNLQTFALENLLFCRGLSWRCRLGYIQMALDILQGWSQFIFLLTPIYSMMADVSPVLPTRLNLILALTGMIALTLLQMLACSRYIRFVQGQTFSMGRMFIQIAATRGLLGKKMPWQISLKNVLGRVALDKLLAHVVLLIGTVLALIYAVVHMVAARTSPTAHPDTFWLLLMASGWVLFNGWRTAAWIIDSVRLTRRTHREYLFEARLPVLDESGALVATTRRLSTQQCELEQIRVGQTFQPNQKLTLLIPGHRVEVIVAEAGPGTMIEMNPADATARDLLRRSLYSVDWHRQPRLSCHMHSTREIGLGGEWEPVRLRTANGDHWAQRLRAPQGFTQDRLLITREMETVHVCMMERLEAGVMVQAPVRFGREIMPACPLPKGLLGTAFAFFEKAA